MTGRANPYDVAFAPIAPERFPRLTEGLRDAGRDARDRDAFVLVREVVELLRELGPEEGLGEGVEELVALTHAAYLYWLDGESRVGCDRETLDRLFAGPGPARPVNPGRAYYLELPPRRVWGDVSEGGAPEPLDGWFALPGADRLDLVAVFGLHPGRDGFTVVTASGPRQGRLIREDRTPLFSPRMKGGAEAGLHQVLGGEELLELGYRCHDLLPASGAAPGIQRVSLV